MKKLKIGSDFSGVGALDQALIRLGVDYEKSFACDMDRYARNTYLINFGTAADMELLKTPDVKKIDDIYYRWFVNTKLKPPTEEEIKFIQENEERVANLFSFYYPWNVYNRKIPKESLDLSVHTCPCQAFSLAGKRKGEEDRRGILFYNSHEFISKNLPRYFIFENVKGLLSDDKGKTFERWIDLLGGKSVNGNPVIFPNEESVPYHVYYKVLNAKEHGVPQNRERIFIIGIRDDEDYQFNFPKPFHLEKRLKDVLESNVPDKYFLSDKMVDFLIGHAKKHQEKGNGFNFKPKEPESIANAINARVFKMGVDDNYIESSVLLNINKFNDYSESEISATLTAGGTAGSHNLPLVQVVCFGRSEEEKERLICIIEHRGHLNKEAKFIYDGIVPCLRAESHGHESKILINSNTKWESIINQEQSIFPVKRIRRLTPLEAFRLMDFNENFKCEVADTHKYKQAGNSVVVKHFEDLVLKLFLR